MPIKDIDFPSATDENSTAQTTLLSIRRDNANEYLYVKAGAAISAGAACKFDETVATGGTVLMTTNTMEFVVGISVSAITSGDHFWLQTKGKVTSALTSTSAAAGDALATGATDGTLEVAAATDYGNVRVVALADDSSGVTPVYLL